MDAYFFWFTLLLSVVVILVAYFKRSMDFSAVLASGLVGALVIITLGGDWLWIYLILAFFALGNLISRYKRSVKEQYHVGQGKRTFRNVFGNGGAATVFALVYWLTQRELFLVGIAGAMAAATADTFATEIGQVYEKRPRLITSFKRVDVGISGAVSSYGLLAALVGSSIISAITLILNQEVCVFLICTISGFIGCNIDSFLGATIEKKMLNTHLVNFIATFLAGIIAASLFYLSIS